MAAAFAEHLKRWISVGLKENLMENALALLQPNAFKSLATEPGLARRIHTAHLA
jgi:hypothetical protein